MQIITKEFNSLKMRILLIDGIEWFVAKDIATILEYVETAKAIRTHCKKIAILGDFQGVSKLDTPYKLDPQTRLILESDVWRLIIKSTMPEAEKIENWIMEEVLPSIRKTGSYSISEPHQNKLQNLDLSSYTQESEKIFKLVELINSKSVMSLYFADKLSKKLNIQSPIELLEINLENYYLIPTELGKLINLSAIETNKILEAKGFQFRENGVWQLTEFGKEFGIEVSNGSFLQIKWQIKALI